jgi:hypothetical protein
MSLIMGISPALCFAVCGAIWMVGGQFLAPWVLTFDERRVISKNLWSTGFGFILLSILAFACLGTLTFDIWLMFWFMGAAVVLLAFGLHSKRKFARNVAYTT